MVALLTTMIEKVKPLPVKATDRQLWIAETQKFQRIAGTPESSDEELGKDWDEMRRPGQKRRALDSISIHRAIQDVARRIK